MAQAPQKPTARRELTGRMVLACLVGFFGVVFAVNGVLVRAALSTFGGVETKSSYQAGLYFNKEQAAAQRQDELHWTVTGKLRRTAPDATALTVNVLGEDGRPPANIHVSARLMHPADERHDHDVALRETGGGVFSGPAVVEAGQWDLEINVLRGDERMFRSLTRVRLQ